MTDEFEATLRRALRRETPPETFTESVMEQVSRPPQAHKDSRRMPASRWRGGLSSSAWAFLHRPRPAVRWALATALTGVFVAVGVAHWRSESLARARGMRARAELLQALSVTAETLDSTRRMVLRAEGNDS